MPQTICSLPPLIQQYFSNILLQTPCKLCEDSDTLYQVYQYIKRKLQKKTYRCPVQDKKFIEMEMEFLDLYGRTKAKEDEYKEKTGKSYQEPFDYFKDTSRYHKGLFGRIKYRR